MYTQFPLDQLQHLYSNIRGHPVKHFTFIGEELKEFECCKKTESNGEENILYEKTENPESEVTHGGLPSI